MRYRCTKGCRSRGGKFPAWHGSKAECPYEPDYAGPRTGTTPSGAAADARAPEPAKAPSAPPAAAPAPEPKKRLLTWGSKPASVTSRAAPVVATAEVEWEVDADHSLDAFQLLDNFVLRIVHFFDGLLGAKKGTEFEPYAGGLILHNAADEELVKKMMGRRMVTRFTRFMGAKTQEDAHSIIESGGVILLVGARFFSIGSHAIAAWNHSPKLVAWREKREQKKAEAERKAREALNVPRAEGTPG